VEISMQTARKNSALNSVTCYYVYALTENKECNND
jgi:hypothetical protein